MDLDPTILCMPNIPRPLAGIAPRKIIGPTEWDIMRRECYATASNCCQVCGVHKDQAPIRQQMEAHERYEFQPNGILVFRGPVCLCPACHGFIHYRFNIRRWNQGLITDRDFETIDARLKIIKDAGLFDQWAKRHYWRDPVKPPMWKDYRMLVYGKYYGPSSASLENYRKGAWEDWEPVENPLPDRTDA